MSTGYEQDWLTVKPDDPKKESFRRRAIEVSLWVSISRSMTTNCSEPKGKKRGMVGCFREEEEEVVIKFEEMVEVARVELATIALIN